MAVQDPYTNAAVAAWYWQSRNINECADQGDFEKVTRLIHGGLNGYSDHLQFWERAKKVIGLSKETTNTNERFQKLNVPYFSQLDNDTDHFGSGARQCNLTSCSMLLAFLRPELVEKAESEGYHEFESMYGETLAKYGDTTSNQANTEALKDFQVETYFSYELSIEDLIRCLQAGYPVVMGMAYKGSGHMVVATGFDLDKEKIFIHDPYGIRCGSGDSYQVGEKAAYDPYSFSLLKQIWVYEGEKAGWGRVTLAVKGKSTGLDNL